MERVFLSLLLLAATALAANSGFDAVAHLNRLPPGAMYLVDGRRMRIDCTGSGTPTIVLDAGHGNDGLIWDGIQPILARTTRVCSYDRAGFGWSDPVLVPRDADHIATELHKLLTAAGIKDPVVLMGHSLAGFYIRDYGKTRHVKPEIICRRHSLGHQPAPLPLGHEPEAAVVSAAEQIRPDV